MSLFSPLIGTFRALKEKGVVGTWKQLYMLGQLKFGDLKGTDVHGNKYFENLDYPFGQHRWVEYANIHNYDASMIHPDWHGWMHHVFDETPGTVDLSQQSRHGVISQISHAPYKTHQGKHDPTEHDKFAQHDVSQYRQRGYKVDSLMSTYDEPEAYYKQPAHPMSPLVDTARFKANKAWQVQLAEEEEKMKKFFPDEK